LGLAASHPMAANTYFLYLFILNKILVFIFFFFSFLN